MTDENNGKSTEEFSDFILEKRRKAKAYSPAPSRDTESVEIRDGDSGEGAPSFRIPPAGRDPAASEEMKRKQREAAARLRTSDYSGHSASFDRRGGDGRSARVRQEQIILEYVNDSCFVRGVCVKSWPGGQSFYDKFVKDAARSHALGGAPAPHVPFFSYIPQYSHLSQSMMAYYLYMKEQLRRGVRLPDADFSYVLLYIYEIINLDGIIDPIEASELLARIWVLYRPMHPSLDKYLSEWLADYCLIHNVPLPRSLAPILGEVGAKSTLKEFFADGAVSMGVPLGRMIRMSLSDYSAAKSKYAREIDSFASEVDAVFDAVIAEHFAARQGIFAPSMLKITNVTRDAYCGSLCAATVKRKVTVTLVSFFRSPEARRVVTELMKGSENIVRARHGIKARLTVPPVTGQAAIISAKSDAERAYLSFYDTPSEPLTPERAAEIEAESWKNAETLTDDGEYYDELSEDTPEVEGAVSSECFEAPDCMESDAGEGETPSVRADEGKTTFGGVLSATPLLIGALKAAMDGKGFSAYCRGAGLFADDAASKINEAAMEFIGDVVLETDGTDYVFVEDYRDEISL